MTSPQALGSNGFGFAGSSILRVSGIPARYWLLGSNPALFSRVACLRSREDARKRNALDLADRIGQGLIPDDRLSSEDRRFLLALRRKLYRLNPIETSVSERLWRINQQLGDQGRLFHDLTEWVQSEEAIITARSDLDHLVQQEQHRLQGIPNFLRSNSPVARAILPPPGEPRDTVVGLASKEARGRLEWEWNLITRAATVTTPRGWFSHVALLPVRDRLSSEELSLSADFATFWTENVRKARLRSQQTSKEWPYLLSTLALNPLHWRTVDKLVIYVTEGPGGPVRVSLPRTDELDALFNQLGQVKTFRQLAIVLGCSSVDERSTLRRILRDLQSIGVVQPYYAATSRFSRVDVPNPRLSGKRHAPQDDGWIDVYRFTRGTLSPHMTAAIQEDVGIVWHTLQMLRESSNQGIATPLEASGRTWTFDEILATELGSEDSSSEGKQNSQAAPDQGGSSTGNSNAPLDSIVTTADGRVLINKPIVSGSESELPAFDWPLDCLVRLPAPGSGHPVLIEEIRPAGQLDARFHAALCDLHGTLAHADAYREFLRRLEELTGAIFVEVLAPPLLDQAANAVRRPLYTSAWTGDPHAAAYFAKGSGTAQFLPLNHIQLQRAPSGHLVAHAHGQMVWPIHHATRTFSKPWDQIARLLLAASPLPAYFPGGALSRHIRSQLFGTAGRSIPRVSTRSGTVISPQRWEIPIVELWDQRAPLREKLLGLSRFRDKYVLPRWVLPSSDKHESAIACDLESLLSIRQLERVADGQESISLDEMVPSPEDAVVSDEAHSHGDRLGAQILLRFPHDETPVAMAERLLPVVHAAMSGTEICPRDGKAAALTPTPQSNIRWEGR